MHMPQNLILIPLDDTVVFPTMDVTLPVDTGNEDRVLLVPRHEGEYASVGTIARVAELVRLPGGGRGATLEGIARGVAGAAQNDPSRHLREDVESGAQKQQREYFLRKQMESIRRELGEDDASAVDEYRRKIEESGMPDHVREQAERELDRLERMGEGGAGESQMIRTYLDWM